MSEQELLQVGVQTVENLEFYSFAQILLNVLEFYFVSFYFILFGIHHAHRITHTSG